MEFPLSVPGPRAFDVFGFGTNAVDLLITVPSYPKFASKIEFLEQVRYPGGEVATTCVGLQRLGFRTSYCGRFGDDDAGSYGIQTLEDEGVDTRFCATVSKAATQAAFIIIDEISGERTVIWKRDPLLSIDPDDAPVRAVEDCRILHMTHHDTPACIRLAEAARSLGVPVSLDVDDAVDGIEDLLSLVDILVVGSEFPRKLLGIDDPRTALRHFHSRYGNVIAGITLGANGSLLYCGGKFFETPGFAVPGGCRDTTGAGDAFRVGLLAGILQRASIEESGRMANAAAALKCRMIGARTALPTKEELTAFL